MPDPFFNPDSNNSYTFGFNLDESSFGLHLSDDTDEESFTGTAGTSKEGSTSSKTADQSATSGVPMDIDDSYQIQLEWTKVGQTGLILTLFSNKQKHTCWMISSLNVLRRLHSNPLSLEFFCGFGN